MAPIPINHLSTSLLRFVLVNNLDANKDGMLSMDEEPVLDALVTRGDICSEKNDALYQLKAALRAPSYVPRTAMDAATIARAINGDDDAIAAVEPNAMRPQEKLSLIGTLAHSGRCEGSVAKALVLSVGEESWNEFRALGIRQGDCIDLFKVASTTESPAEIREKQVAAVRLAVRNFVIDFKKYYGSEARGSDSQISIYADALLEQHLGTLDFPPDVLHSGLQIEIWVLEQNSSIWNEWGLQNRMIRILSLHLAKISDGAP